MRVYTYVWEQVWHSFDLYTVKNEEITTLFIDLLYRNRKKKVETILDEMTR